MPVNTHDAYLVEAALSRAISLPRFRFQDAQHNYEEATTDIIVSRTRLGPRIYGATSSISGMINVETDHENKSFSKTLENVVTRSGRTITLAHEAVHVAQRLNLELGASIPSRQLPYRQRPYEIEAFQLQRSLADYIKRIQKVTNPTANLDSPYARTSTLLNATRKLLEKRADQLKNSNKQSIEDPEIRQLTDQLQSLQQRIESLQSIEDQNVSTESHEEREQ